MNELLYQWHVFITCPYFIIEVNSFYYLNKYYSIYIPCRPTLYTRHDVIAGIQKNKTQVRSCPRGLLVPSGEELELLTQCGKG